MIVGSLLEDNDQADEGRVYVYYGNERDGLDRIPRQARSDDSAPIGLLGKSDSETSFRLKALGRTPSGRGKVNMEWEIKPLRTPFDSIGLQEGSKLNTGAPGGSGSAVALGEVSSGLTAGTFYKWRMRIRSNSPFVPHSPWLTLPYNGRTEGDLQTACGASVPCGTPDLRVLPSGSDTLLSWTTTGTATAYDLVRGDLGTLLANGGDFSLATQTCVVNNNPTTSFIFSGTPPAGDAYWFLVRSVNGGGAGTYDSLSPSQVGDAEILASGNDCP